MPETRVETGNIFAISDGSAPENSDFKRPIQHTMAISTSSDGVGVEQDEGRIGGQDEQDRRARS